MYFSLFWCYSYKEDYVQIYNELTKKTIDILKDEFNLILGNKLKSDLNSDIIKLLINEKLLFKDEIEFFEYYTNVSRKNARKIPFVMEIELTNICDAKCIMCPREKLMKRKAGYMSKELFVTICQKIKNSQNWLGIQHFGDPALHPQLIEFIKIAKSYNINTGFSCHAYHFKNNLAIDLVQSGLSQLTCSLDSLNDSTYKYIRKVKATVEDNIKAIKNLVKLKKEYNSKLLITMQMLRMKYNKDEWDDFVKLGKEIGVDRIAINQLIEWQFGNKLFNDLKVEPRPEYDKACEMPWNMIDIEYDGSIVPCNMDPNGDLKIGNIKDLELNQVFSGKRYKEIFILNKNNKLCDTCCKSITYKEKLRSEVGFEKFHKMIKKPSQWLYEDEISNKLHIKVGRDSYGENYNYKIQETNSETIK